MLKTVLLTFGSTAALMAAGGGGEGTDIFPRVVNFLIFVAILYYLLADRIKGFFVGRREGISDDLKQVQEKLKESIRHKEEAAKKVEDAKKRAVEILEHAKKESTLIEKQYEESLKDEIEMAIKHNNDQMEYQKRKREKEVTEEILNELLESPDVSVEKSSYAEIIQRKVA